MTYWTNKRRASLAIHATVVLIPFGFSTGSALLFWQALFQSWLIAAPMVGVVDMLALLGLVLYLVRIESPFVALRHLLPFISVVPLGLELYALLEHNGAWVAVPATVVVIGVMVGVAWQCFRTIEQLFVSPIEAAREKAREQVRALTISMAQLREIESAADEFALERLQYRMPQVTVATVADASGGTRTPLSRTAQVKQIASERNVSESTVWRWISKGTITLESED